MAQFSHQVPAGVVDFSAPPESESSPRHSEQPSSSSWVGSGNSSRPSTSGPKRTPGITVRTTPVSHAPANSQDAIVDPVPTREQSPAAPSSVGYGWGVDRSSIKSRSSSMCSNDPDDGSRAVVPSHEQSFHSHLFHPRSRGPSLLAGALSSLANSSRLGTPNSQRLGSAGSNRLGSSGSNRLGTAGSNRVGTSGSSRLATAGSSRLGTTESARVGTADSAHAGRHGWGAKVQPATIAPGTEAYVNLNEESPFAFDINRPPPFSGRENLNQSAYHVNRSALDHPEYSGTQMRYLNYSKRPTTADTDMLAPPGTGQSTNVLPSSSSQYLPFPDLQKADLAQGASPRLRQSQDSQQHSLPRDLAHRAGDDEFDHLGQLPVLRVTSADDSLSQHNGPDDDASTSTPRCSRTTSTTTSSSATAAPQT